MTNKKEVNIRNIFLIETTFLLRKIYERTEIFVYILIIEVIISRVKS